MHADAPTARRLLLAIAGFLLWSGAFVALYGLQAVGCHLGWHRTGMFGISLHRAILGTIFLAVLAVAVAITAHAARLAEAGTTADGSMLRRFLDRIGLWTNLAACGAIAATFIPLFVLATC